MLSGNAYFMIALVRIALSRPYTFVVLALLLLIIGPLAALRTPTDIFPDIRIPVIGVVWEYTGLPPDDIVRHLRREFVEWFRQPQDLFSAERRYPHRQRPGHRDFANADQADAAWRDAAADPHLQRVHGSDHPGTIVRRGP